MADDKDKKGKATTENEPKIPPPPPRPNKLLVTSSGKNGQYTFDLQVISDQGQGIKARILAIEGDHSRVGVETDDDGYAEHQAAPFTDEEQEFLFQVLGTDILQEVTLDGPGKSKPQRKQKKLVPGGFWANVKQTIKENQERKKNK